MIEILKVVEEGTGKVLFDVDHIKQKSRPLTSFTNSDVNSIMTHNIEDAFFSEWHRLQEEIYNSDEVWKDSVLEWYILSILAMLKCWHLKKNFTKFIHNCNNDMLGIISVEELFDRLRLSLKYIDSTYMHLLSLMNMTTNEQRDDIEMYNDLVINIMNGEKKSDKIEQTFQLAHYTESVYHPARQFISYARNYSKIFMELQYYD